MEEILRIRLHPLRPRVSIIVLNFVVVPRHQAWRRAVEGLQIRVGAIKGVAVAIAGEVAGGGTVMLAHDPVRLSVRISVLVDVIPKEDHEVGILLGHVPVRAEVAHFPVRTGGEGEPHTLRLCARRWSGLGAAYGALLT